MTPEEKKLVQESFAKVAPMADQAAALFYLKLFRHDPALRALFKGDMQEQGRKLMTMLATAVGALDRIESIVPAVQDLARRHVHYGVRPEHYDLVGAALLETLQEGLGGEFTPAARSAWATVYVVLASTMKDAAYSDEPLATASD